MPPAPGSPEDSNPASVQDGDRTDVTGATNRPSSPVSSPVRGSDPLKSATDALGAVAGIRALIFFAGSSILALRYEGLGLPPVRATTAVPREYAFGIGAQATAVWGLTAALVVDVQGEWLYRGVQSGSRKTAYEWRSPFF